MFLGKVRRFILGFLIGILLIGNVCTQVVHAYTLTESGEIGGWEDPVTTWTQWGMPESNSIILPGSSGLSMKTAACGWFSGYYALYKAGIVDPKSYNVKNLVADAKEKGAYFGGWLLDYGKLKDIFPSHKIEKIKDEDIGSNSKWYGGWGLWLDNLGQDDAIKVAQTLLKRGYYIVLCLRSAETDGHYVFLDYVDPNKPDDIRIVDSAFKYTWISEYKSFASKSMSFGEMWVLDLSQGKESGLSFNRASLYEDGPKQSNNSPEITANDASSIISELKLEGMNNYQQETSKFQKPVYPGLKLENPLDLINSQKIAESKRVNPWLELLSKTISALGFTLFGYGIFLVIFYISFGKVYPKMMKVVFFNRYVLTEDTEPVKGGLTIGQFALRVGAMLVIGILLASGELLHLLLT